MKTGWQSTATGWDRVKEWLMACGMICVFFILSVALGFATYFFMLAIGGR